MIKEFPPYVSAVKPDPSDPDARLCICHEGDGGYYRHAGAWCVDAGFDADGVLRVTTDTGPLSHMHGLELYEVDEATWRACNSGHAPREAVARAVRDLVARAVRDLSVFAEDDEPSF